MTINFQSYPTEDLKRYIAEGVDVFRHVAKFEAIKVEIAAREAAFDAFMVYKSRQTLNERRRLRAKYQNERGMLKAGVMKYMRLTGDMVPR